MKKLLASLVLFALLLMFGQARADSGVSVGNRSVAVLNAVASTAGVTNTSVAFAFDHPMNQLTCDLLLSSGTVTGTFLAEGNAGSSTTLFAPANLQATTIVIANQINTFFVANKSFRIFRVKYFNELGGNTNVTVNCFGVQ